MAAEMCLLQLPALLSGEPGAEFRPSPFFAEQLTAFELWLAHGSVGKQPPEQLPIVLQVCPCSAAPAQRSQNEWGGDSTWTEHGSECAGSAIPINSLAA